jgi:hypothetical protein
MYGVKQAFKIGDLVSFEENGNFRMVVFKTALLGVSVAWPDSAGKIKKGLFPHRFLILRKEPYGKLQCGMLALLARYRPIVD